MTSKLSCMPHVQLELASRSRGRHTDIAESLHCSSDKMSKSLLSSGEEDKEVHTNGAGDHSNGCCKRCMDCYQSSDTESRVTPFAVVILMVLFVIYVLNQADRLVLPVSIPAGLR